MKGQGAMAAEVQAEALACIYDGVIKKHTLYFCMCCSLSFLHVLPNVISRRGLAAAACCAVLLLLHLLLLTMVLMVLATRI
jgi:hypothetical protein